MFEASFTHTGTYVNPYVELAATARFTEPDGRTTRSIPLFWDGGDTWRARFSPDKTGQWTWGVRSNDPGLDGKGGSFKVVDSGNRGGICPMEGHPHHFQHQNGEPMWFIGDTAWALYTDNEEKGHNRAAVERYIDARAAQGFNVVHSMLISESGWGNCQGDAFEDLQAERINPAYWQEVDERLAYLNRRGMTGGLVLAWGDKGKNPNDWREFPSQEARLRYARYVAARYSASDVYFVVAGEWNADIRHTEGLAEEQARSDYREIGEAIQHSDPHDRMIGIHPMIVGTVREFAPEPWMGFGDYQQMYSHLHAEVLASRWSRCASRLYGRHLGKPVVNSEYAYYLRDQDEDGVVDKHNSFDLDTIRHATWDIAMAGGYFITGFGSTYFGGLRNPGPFDVDAPQNALWESQVQQVKQLFTDLDWWRLEPRDDLVSASVKRGEDRRIEHESYTRPLLAPPEVTYWALAEEGRQYVCYVRGVSGKVMLSLGQGTGRTYQLRQFDPRTGEYREIGIQKRGDRIEYIPPNAWDWVLVIE
jgi:hypothetical protein